MGAQMHQIGIRTALCVAMKSSFSRFGSPAPIRLGYVPLIDCAPLAVAHETGIFERHGLNVELSREISWTTIRDRIFYGGLDASQAISGIAFALGLGLTGLKCEVAVPLVLNVHGSAITLSKKIAHEKIGKGEGLRSFIDHSWKDDRPLTLAASHRCSSHHILLHTWLKNHGLDPATDVNIVFQHPPLMAQQLKAGEIDGYCAGEPWNSEAILGGIGWSPAISADLSPGHPEKVLLLSGNFLRERAEESSALVTALLEACALCQDPFFRPDLISILSRKEYTGASTATLANSLGETFNSGIGLRPATGFHLFHGDSVNRPTVEKASWVLAGLRNTGTFPDSAAGSISRIFREDLYHAATMQVW